MMERIKIIPQFIPNEHIFETFDESMEWVKQNVKDEH